MKVKTYVITLSKKFMSDHPRSGQPTDFEASVKGKRKIHTLRNNFPFWEKRIKEIQDGTARLSIRQWTGKPYRSKQIEIMELTAKDGVGIQRATITRSEWKEDKLRHFSYWVEIGENEIPIETIAQNDGFAFCPDFMAWFDPSMEKQKPNNEGWKTLELAIIHFTKFRYKTEL